MKSCSINRHYHHELLSIIMLPCLSDEDCAQEGQCTINSSAILCDAMNLFTKVMVCHVRTIKEGVT